MAVTQILVRVAHDARFRRLMQSRGATSELVSRLVVNDSVSALTRVTAQLQARGRVVSLLHLATTPLDQAEAHQRRRRLRKVLRRLGQGGYTSAGRVEVCLRLGALGAHIPAAGRQIALANAQAVTESAAAVGARVVILPEPGVPHVDLFACVDALRAQAGDVGVGLIAAHRNIQADLAERIASGCRVRLCRGWHHGADGLDRHKTEVAYVRALATLFNSDIPFSLTAEDRRILNIADTLTAKGVRPTDVEYHLGLGVNAMTEATIADRGDVMRVLVPFGQDWYPYVVERLAWHPKLALTALSPSRP